MPGASFDSSTTGSAFGWSIRPSLVGWRWHAYGPGGTSSGIARSEVAAGVKARAEAERLSRPTGEAA